MFVALALAFGIAGCGIPSETDVRADGNGPAPWSGSDSGVGEPPETRAQSGDDPPKFAENFLQAAAGETGEAYKRVWDFIASENRSQLRERQDVAINVVRLTEATPRVTANSDGSYTVRVLVQQVGVLTKDGTVSPPTETASEYTFTVGRLGRGNGLWVLKPPPVLLLSTEGLKKYYQPRVIYFWNPEQTALIPDLRYMPAAIPRERQATEILSWLTSGPPPWLKTAAVGLPDRTQAIDNVPDTGDRLVVNLSAEALPTDNPAQVDRLGAQLMWSLRDSPGSQLELKIQGQTRKTFDVQTFLSANPLYRMADAPQRFCVYEGQVHPLVTVGDGAASDLPIANEVNRNVVSAAFGRAGDTISAALVSPAGNRRRLLAGSSPGKTVAALERSQKTYGSMGRPVWLKTLDVPVGLVVADGRLYQFGSDAQLVRVDLSNSSGKVTAVGAAPDGHRIAFVAGGKLYVAALTVDGGVVEAGPARQVPSSLRDLVEVDWIGEKTLVVAGMNAENRVAFYDISVDGAVEIPRGDDIGGAEVTHVAAYPDVTSANRGGGAQVMFEANGVAFDASRTPPVRIDPDQVSGVTPKPRAGNPTAPFFLY